MVFSGFPSALIRSSFGLSANKFFGKCSISLKGKPTNLSFLKFLKIFSGSFLILFWESAKWFKFSKSQKESSDRNSIWFLSKTKSSSCDKLTKLERSTNFMVWIVIWSSLKLLKDSPMPEKMKVEGVKSIQSFSISTAVPNLRWFENLGRILRFWVEGLW